MVGGVASYVSARTIARDNFQIVQAGYGFSP